MRDLTCTEVADSAPGFALDILEPEKRARVAAHLIRCCECRRSVTDMEASAAELLGPDHGAVGGPEEYGDTWYEVPMVRPARRRLRMVVTMATVAALFVGTTFGPEMTARSNSRPIASGVLLAGDTTVGTVRLYAGTPPVIEVETDHLPTSGRLGVVVTYRDGTARRIGDIQVRGGRAGWVAPEPAGGGGAITVMLVDSARHEVAAASIH